VNDNESLNMQIKLDTVNNFFQELIYQVLYCRHYTKTSPKRQVKF